MDVLFTPEEYAEGRNLLIGMVASGVGAGMIRDFNRSGEHLTMAVWSNLFLLSTNGFPRWLINKLLGAIGMGRLVEGTQCLYIQDKFDYEQFLHRRKNFAYRMSKKWQDLGISAMVTPSFPHCSFKAKHADDMGLMLEYIFLWNVLNYPSGIVPVTTVQPDEQDFTDNYNDGWTKLLKETAKDSAGMPIPVQVISHSFEDEKCLGVMQAIDREVNFRMQPKE